ncbi:hypothetical protein PBI_SCTP2_345 [Salicola phage SCTP-2]|nr:hypothetical protein PBI_SCTP2_345 [Salicola phage SCTP-2]
MTEHRKNNLQKTNNYNLEFLIVEDIVFYNESRLYWGEDYEKVVQSNKDMFESIDQRVKNTVYKQIGKLFFNNIRKSNYWFYVSLEIIKGPLSNIYDNNPNIIVRCYLAFTVYLYISDHGMKKLKLIDQIIGNIIEDENGDRLEYILGF